MHRNQNFNKYRQNNLFKQKKETVKTEVEKNDLSKYLPYIGPLLIFFGVTRLIFYYSNFNINILPFLEFSEIITSIFDLFVALIFIISIFSLSLLISEITRSNKSNINKGTFYIAFIALFLLAIVILGQNQLSLEYFGTLSPLLATIMMLYFYLTQKKKTSDENEYSLLIYFFYFSIIALGLLVILIDSRSASLDVKKRKKYYGVKVIFNDMQELTSDSTVYYIGNTNKYIFIYNEKENSTIVRKLDDVKSIVFPKGFNK